MTRPKKAALRLGEKEKTIPKSKYRLIKAMKTLLVDKTFHAITTAELARTANANEALIYRYFGDKRGLLHYVLAEYMQEVNEAIDNELDKITDPLEKLRRFVWLSLDAYNSNRVFAKILLIEVRNYPGYFESDTYQLIRRYAQTLLGLIEEAQKNGVVRSDIPAKVIRNAILGMAEHLCLPGVLFGKPFSANTITDNLFSMVIDGILEKP